MQINYRRLFFSFILFSALLVPHVVRAQDDADSNGEELKVWDPLEPMNRGVFWFNQKFDRYILEPVATGYNKVMPDSVQSKVGNFFTNLTYPAHLVGDLISLHFSDAAHDTGRFLVNSTVGCAGFFDVATDWGLPEHKQDIGLSLGMLGVPSGPYIVLPFLGPSNLRDTFGWAGDIVLDPIYWTKSITGTSTRDAFIISSSATALKVVNVRSQRLEDIKSAREAAVDYYLFLQGAYSQYRDGQLRKQAEKDKEKEKARESAPEKFAPAGTKVGDIHDDRAFLGHGA